MTTPSRRSHRAVAHSLLVASLLALVSLANASPRGDAAHPTRQAAHETARNVGHTMRDAARTVGHATRNAAREIGHAFRRLAGRRTN